MEKKTAIITGGAQGIGKILSLKFMAAGYYTCILDNDKEAIEEFKTEQNHQDLLFLICDVSDEKQVQKVLMGIVEKCGRLDVLINNAAVSINKSIEKLSLKEWNRVLAVNPPVHLCQNRIPKLIRRPKEESLH